MRKIEQQMIEFIRSKKVSDGEHWKSGNTRVAHLGGSVFNVYLHDNLIAYVKDGAVYPNKEMFRRWPTPTTRSRLRALGVDAYIKDHVAYIDES